jgi:hypothetical protein
MDDDDDEYRTGMPLMPIRTIHIKSTQNGETVHESLAGICFMLKFILLKNYSAGIC